MVSRLPLDESTLERGDAGRSSNLSMTLRVELCMFVVGLRSADVLDTRHWGPEVTWGPTKLSRPPSTLMEC